MESIGLMAGGVAHDLNNILAGIIGYPELLLKTLPATSNLREPLRAILESGQRAAMVVADLLTVARGVAIAKEIRNLNLLIKEYLDSPEHRKLNALYSGISYENQFVADLFPEYRNRYLPHRGQCIFLPLFHIPGLFPHQYIHYEWKR